MLDLLTDGCRRSATLRELARDLARTDGIVYIEAGRCPIPSLKACLLHSIVDAGDARYLWIRVAVRRNPRDAISTMAHELQHALEVLRQPWIRSRFDVLQHFRSFENGAFGSTPQGSPISSYETGAAIDVGRKVHGELAAPADAAPVVR